VLILLYTLEGVLTLFPYFLLGSGSATTGRISDLEELVGGLVAFCLPYFIATLVAVVLTRRQSAQEATVITGASIIGTFVLQAGLQLLTANLILSDPANVLLFYYGELITVVLPQIPLLVCLALIGRLSSRKLDRTIEGLPASS
jgi:hypothetical protein